MRDRKTEAERKDERNRRLAYGEGERESQERARLFARLSDINGLHYVRLRLCRQTVEEYRREDEAWAQKYLPATPRVEASLSLLDRRESLERECGIDSQVEREFELELVAARRVHRRITGEDFTPEFLGSECVATRMQAYDRKLLEFLDTLYEIHPDLVYMYHCGVSAPRGRYRMPEAGWRRFGAPPSERLRRERQDIRSRQTTSAQDHYEDFDYRVARRMGVSEERVQELRSLRDDASLTRERLKMDENTMDFDSIPF